MLRTALAAALLAGAALPAFAADLPSKAPAAMPVFVAEPSPWMVRVRALGVIPDASADWKVNGAALPGASIDISSTIVPELDITYFFTQNIAAELVLGTTPHNLSGKGTAINGLRDRARLAAAADADPAVPLHQFRRVQALRRRGRELHDLLRREGQGRFHQPQRRQPVGFALQAGFDYMLDQHWGINVDVKKIWLEPERQGQSRRGARDREGQDRPVAGRRGYRVPLLKSTPPSRTTAPAQ